MFTIGILLLTLSKFCASLTYFNTFCWLIYGNDGFWLKKEVKIQNSEMRNHIVSEDSFTVVKMGKLIDKW